MRLQYPTPLSTTIMQFFAFLLAGESCTFDAFGEPVLGSCAGPTERAVNLREAYPNLPVTMCPIDQMACKINGTYDCF